MGQLPSVVVFCFDLDPLLLQLYDLIFLWIFAASLTPAKLSSLEQPFYFATILWANKSITGQFLRVASYRLPSSEGSAVWSSKMAHVPGSAWCPLLAGNSLGLPSRVPACGLSSVAGSQSLGPLHSGSLLLPASFPRGASWRGLLWANHWGLHVVPVLHSVGCM